jgi:hypothetical protein
MKSTIQSKMKNKLIHILFLGSDDDMYVFIICRIIFLSQLNALVVSKMTYFHLKWCAIDIITIILLIYIKNIIWFAYV